MADAATNAVSLDELLDDISVLDCNQWDNELGPAGWWAVANENGITAYFGDEVDAFRFRLDLINRRLNP